MALKGGCYCGALRYTVEGDAMMKAMCLCRECQHVSGGGPNTFMAIADAGFSYDAGTPKQFARSDIENAVTREFCDTCGTHILTRAPGAPGMVILKIGTLDDPSAYGMPQAAIFAGEAQPWHVVPDGVPSFAGMPTG